MSVYKVGDVAEIEAFNPEDGKEAVTIVKIQKSRISEIYLCQSNETPNLFIRALERPNSNGVLRGTTAMRVGMMGLDETGVAEYLGFNA